MKKILFFLGLLVLQIVITGLIVILAFSSVFIIPFLSAKSPLFLIVGMLGVFLIVLGVPIISAIWARRDVKKFINQGIDAWTPLGWEFVVLFLWLPGFTIYLFLRKFRYKIELQNRNQTA